MKLESGFLQNFVDFIGLLVEILGTDVMVAEQAMEEWKIKLMDSCNKILDTARTAASALGRSRNCPDVVSEYIRSCM